MDSTGATAKMKSSQVKVGSMHSVTLSRALGMGLLPTPKAQNAKAPCIHGQGGMDLQTKAAMNLLPTPTLQDAKNATLPQSQIGRGHLPGYLLTQGALPGSRLNPRYVEEMMGYPINWTDLKA
jgi:hypothetical protein